MADGMERYEDMNNAIVLRSKLGHMGFTSYGSAPRATLTFTIVQATAR